MSLYHQFGFYDATWISWDYKMIGEGRDAAFGKVERSRLIFKVK